MNQFLHPTIEVALIEMPEFAKCIQTMSEHSTLRGLGTRTFKCYTRKLAQLCLVFKKLPEYCSEAEVNSFLTSMHSNGKRPSESDYKLAISSLKFYMTAVGATVVNYKIPSVKSEKKLPVVLSKEECIKLFANSSRSKDGIMLKLIYSAGLRLQELTNLKIGDIDWNRMLIHVRGGKGKKDRYVNLSSCILRDLKNYLLSEKPFLYLFNNSQGRQANKTTISKIMNRAVKTSGIIKKGVSLHTLRHSFATHLMEEGLDIVSIKEMLGHEKLQTTLIYLHVSNYDRPRKFSPLDKLYSEEMMSESEVKIIVNELTEISSRSNAHEEQLRAQISLFEVN